VYKNFTDHAQGHPLGGIFANVKKGLSDEGSKFILNQVEVLT